MVLHRALVMVSLSAIVASAVVMELSNASFLKAVHKEEAVNDEGNLAHAHSVSEAAPAGRAATLASVAPHRLCRLRSSENLAR